MYVIPGDRDLVSVIETSKHQNLQLDVDYGIILYNNTLLKKLVRNGIITISTNFEAMGKILAQMISKGERKQIENKCALILHNSL